MGRASRPVPLQPLTLHPRNFARSSPPLNGHGASCQGGTGLEARPTLLTLHPRNFARSSPSSNGRGELSRGEPAWRPVPRQPLSQLLQVTQDARRGGSDTSILRRATWQPSLACRRAMQRGEDLVTCLPMNLARLIDLPSSTLSHG